MPGSAFWTGTGKSSGLPPRDLTSDLTLSKHNLQQGRFTQCINTTLESGDVYAVHDPVVECSGCMLAEGYKDGGAIAVALTYEQYRYGFMVLSTPKHLTMDPDEKSIIKEVADDIAVALYRMDLEKSKDRSQARFKTLIDNSLNYISIIQADEIVYKSRGLRKIHQFMDHVFDPPEFTKIYEGDRKRIRQAYEDLVAGRIQNLETDFQYYPQPRHDQDETAADEGLRWALISARRIDYLGVASVLTNIMDVTDTKEVENFLRIQDKMTSLGRVTAGIAHEIRNPLSGIYIYLKAIKQIYNQMGDITRVVSIIDKIEQASNKIESIIQRVMDFSKPTRPQFVMADLNRYIDEVTKLTAVTLRKSDITLEKTSGSPSARMLG